MLLAILEIGLVCTRRGGATGSFSQIGSNVERDQVGKTLEKAREDFTRRLMHEPTIGVELLVRVTDEDLWLEQRVRVGEDDRLPQL